MKFLLTTLILLAPSVASADVDCATALSDPDINECASRDFERAETALNAAYKTLLADLKKMGTDIPDALEARQKLIEAQREWVKFRDSDCDAKFALNKGGTIRTLMYFSCMTSHAEQRTKELVGFIE